MSSLGAAISGLQSSQKWLDVISNNISNSQTVAYKAGRLTFSDLISSQLSAASAPSTSSNLGGINANQIGLGVTVGSVQTIMSQGSLQTTGNATDIAINGSGFLTVNKGSSTVYSRAGNLTFDSAGNLVTSDGGQVQGWSLKSQITGTAPTSITLIDTKLDTSNTSNIGNIVIPGNMVLAPKATSNNLLTSVKNEGVTIAGNLDNNTPQNAAALPMGAQPTAAELAAFTPDAVSNFTVYDSLGTAWNFTLYWQQVNNTPGQASAWQWSMFYTPNGASPSATAQWSPGAATPPEAGAWIGNSSGQMVTNATTNSTLDISFNADGSLASNGYDTATAATSPQNITISLPILNGAIGIGGVGNPTLDFSLNFGTPNTTALVGPPVVAAAFGSRDGLTGDYGSGTYDAVSGVYQAKQTIYTKSVDGYSEGTLTGLAFNQTGGIDARFSNGQVITVAKLAISSFANTGGLERIGNNQYQTTANSGSAIISVAGENGVGTIQGGALESSNVDLTLELTNMIVAQRMFESNAKVITTSSTLLGTLINSIPAQ